MIHIVGAGSGDVDLITVRGARLLEEADTVVYAGSLVNPEILTTYTKSGCKVYDSARMTLEEVLDVLRADHLRACTLEVESSSTAFDETQEDKEARIGLFKGVSDLLNASLPFMQANPEFIDAVKANVLFAVDAFPQSRVLKEAYENAFAAWEARVKAPKPAQPTPEQMLAQAEQLKAQAEIMTAQARAAEAQVKLAQAGEKIKLDRAKLIKDTQKDAAQLALESAKISLK